MMAPQSQIKLRPYQEEFIEQMTKSRGILLGLPMRTGKTLITLETLKRLEPKPKPKGGDYIVILAPKCALYVWYKHIMDLSYNDYLGNPVVVEGTKAKRLKQWAALQKQLGGVCITTYDTYRIDGSGSRPVIPLSMRHKCYALVADEIHRKCRRKQSETFKFLSNIVAHPLANHRMVIVSSGTLVRKGPEDLWTYLHLVAPKKFPSYWQYINRYCFVIDGIFGKEIVGLSDKERFTREVGPYVIHRRRETLMPDLPIKTRQLLPTTFSSASQQRVYDDLEATSLAALDLAPGADISQSQPQLLISRNALTTLLRLRQWLVCPRILDSNPGAPYGAALELIADHVATEELTNFVVYTPFTAAIPHIQEFLSAKLPAVKFITFKGGMKAEEVHNSAEQFNLWCAEHKPAIAIVSIEYAQGFDLSGADVGYFLGSTWNPDDDEQAEDRMYSMDPSRRNPIVIYYIVHTGCVDENVMKYIDNKYRGAATTMAPLISDQ